MLNLKRVVASRRGIALVHVLVLAIFVTAVGLGLSMMLLQRSQAAARRADDNTQTAADAGGVAVLMNSWNGKVCSSGAGYSCGGSPAGTCGCTCTPLNAGQPYVRTTLCPSGCKVDVANSLPFSAATCP